jgi:uncharacterized protein (DUF58 family)
MSTGPDARLLRTAAALAAAAVLVPVLPALALPWLAGTATLLAALAWDGWLLTRRPPVVARRLLPERAALGVPATIESRVASGSAQATVLTVIDECPPDLADPEPRFVDAVVGGGHADGLRYEILPTRRGDRRFGSILSFERSPLGLLRRRTVHATPDVLPVFPRGATVLGRHTLAIARRIADLGLRPDRRRGAGLEFESLRDYVPGDDPRRLDWAASLRRGRLVTRLHQQERSQTLLVGVDTSRLMGASTGARTKLDHAVDAALALAIAGLIGGDRVGAFAFDRAVRGWAPARPHRRNLAAIVDVLGRIEPTATEASYWDVARTIRVRQPRRALVVVFTDFVEAADETLLEPLHVLGRHHRVLLVAVRDPLFARLDPATPAGAHVDPYERLAIDLLRRGRDAALGRARQAGVQTLDLVPAALTAPVLSRYLELRASPV